MWSPYQVGLVKELEKSAKKEQPKMASKSKKVHILTY